MLRSNPTMLLATALTLGLGASAFAAPAHHHARHARHHAARVVGVPAAAAVGVGVGVLPVIGDDAYLYGPGYRNGADEDLTTDSVGAGREEPVPGPRNVDPRLAYETPYSARGYEIEAPPISPSLPNLPVLTPELLN